jgi:hypothetical protein
MTVAVVVAVVLALNVVVQMTGMAVAVEVEVTITAVTVAVMVVGTYMNFEAEESMPGVIPIISDFCCIREKYHIYSVIINSIL